MLLNQRVRHAGQLRLRSIAVADDAAVDVVGAAGHVGQPRRQQSAGARLGHGDRHLVLAQQIADDLFERTPVHAVDRRSQDVLQFQHGGGERGVGVGLARGLCGEMELDLAEDRQDRRTDRQRLRRPLDVDRGGLRVDVRLGAAGDLQHATEQATAAGLRRQPLGDHRFQHRLHLARWPRQQHDGRRVPLQPQARRRAVRVGQHLGAAGHHRLAAVDLGHRHAAPGKALADALDDRLVHVERDPERARHRVARHVVLGRTEAAGHDDQIRPHERALDHARELADVVGDDGLQAHVVADRVEALSNE